ncbi:hypothetical protein GPECTOR_42g834 [Gonium pectorale]|uniref:Uncharacterized protein n=1 Tax=Gonium pectorale TaxID=33097 RepID=A0A150GA27_GONPE|nr:hypothetical protein GPECTOR_42g834 [Gonium pectorale]|eukprot:KXZ46623.1 hypothetical protein GPECTOR_42g834 [Gonium pectorale]
MLTRLHLATCCVRALQYKGFEQERRGDGGLLSPEPPELPARFPSSATRFGGGSGLTGRIGAGGEPTNATAAVRAARRRPSADGAQPTARSLSLFSRLEAIKVPYLEQQREILEAETRDLELLIEVVTQQRDAARERVEGLRREAASTFQPLSRKLPAGPPAASAAAPSPAADGAVRQPGVTGAFWELDACGTEAAAGSCHQLEAFGEAEAVCEAECAHAGVLERRRRQLVAEREAAQRLLARKGSELAAAKRNLQALCDRTTAALEAMGHHLAAAAARSGGSGAQAVAVQEQTAQEGAEAAERIAGGAVGAAEMPAEVPAPQSACCGGAATASGAAEAGSAPPSAEAVLQPAAWTPAMAPRTAADGAGPAVAWPQANGAETEMAETEVAEMEVAEAASEPTGEAQHRWWNVTAWLGKFTLVALAGFAPAAVLRQLLGYGSLADALVLFFDV